MDLVQALERPQPQGLYHPGHIPLQAGVNGASAGQHTDRNCRRGSERIARDDARSIVRNAKANGETGGKQKRQNQ